MSDFGNTKARDPYTPSGWSTVHTTGPAGPMGPTGTTGPGGPTGTIDPAVEEIISGATVPDPAARPGAEIWFDTSTPPPVHFSLPPGGSDGQSLTAIDGTTQQWAGPNLPSAGGSMSGPLTVNGTTTVNGNLVGGNVDGDTYFTNNISAASIDDRTGYSTEYWDATDALAEHWAGGVTLGGCNLFRNRYVVYCGLNVRRTTYQPDDASWVAVLDTPIPVGWRPLRDLWDTCWTTELTWMGPSFAVKVQADGFVFVSRRSEWQWQDNSTIPINLSWPRPPG